MNLGRVTHVQERKGMEENQMPLLRLRHDTGSLALPQKASSGNVRSTILLSLDSPLKITVDI